MNSWLEKTTASHYGTIMAIQKELEEGDLEAVRIGLEALREAVSFLLYAIALPSLPLNFLPKSTLLTAYPPLTADFSTTDDQLKLLELHPQHEREYRILLHLFVLFLHKYQNLPSIILCQLLPFH